MYPAKSLFQNTKTKCLNKINFLFTFQDKVLQFQEIEVFSLTKVSFFKIKYCVLNCPWKWEAWNHVLDPRLVRRGRHVEPASRKVGSQFCLDLLGRSKRKPGAAWGLVRSRDRGFGSAARQSGRVRGSRGLSGSAPAARRAAPKEACRGGCIVPTLKSTFRTRAADRLFAAPAELQVGAPKHTGAWRPFLRRWIRARGRARFRRAILQPASASVSSDWRARRGLRSRWTREFWCRRSRGQCSQARAWFVASAVRMPPISHPQERLFGIEHGSDKIQNFKKWQYIKKKLNPFLTPACLSWGIRTWLADFSPPQDATRDVCSEWSIPANSAGSSCQSERSWFLHHHHM